MVAILKRIHVPERELPKTASRHRPHLNVEALSETTETELTPGTLLDGQYEVIRMIGSGSVGTVYLCRDQTLLNELVAVKVLSQEIAQNEIALHRYKQQTRDTFSVSHPNILRAFPFFVDGEITGLPMEYMGGGNLLQFLQERPWLSLEEIYDIIEQICDGLAVIHRDKAVHRGLKPENILLSEDGSVKIADFSSSHSNAGHYLLDLAVQRGFVDYMSPETIENDIFDVRSDIYSVGMIAYMLVSGRSAFANPKGEVALDRKAKREAPPLKRKTKECPKVLASAILKAIRRRPEQRYKSVLEFKLAFQNAKLTPIVEAGSALDESMTLLYQGFKVSAVTAVLAVLVMITPGMEFRAEEFFPEYGEPLLSLTRERLFRKSLEPHTVIMAPLDIGEEETPSSEPTGTFGEPMTHAIKQETPTEVPESNSEGVLDTLQEEEEVAEENSFVHTVTHRGETLSLLALWYTGSLYRWKQLAEANPEMNPAVLSIGDRLSIPEELLKRKTPPTEAELRTLAPSTGGARRERNSPSFLYIGRR